MNSFALPMVHFQHFNRQGRSAAAEKKIREVRKDILSDYQRCI
jgi:hypothetical protein